MKNLICLMLIGLFLASCGSSKEIEEIKSEPIVENKNQISDENGGIRDRPRRTAIDPEQLVAQLGLDETQEKEFLAHWESQEAAMKTMRDEFKGDRDGMRAKMMELRDSNQAKLGEILTKEQMAQYLKIMSENRGRGTKEGKGRG